MLKRLTIKKLFELYSYDISFNESWDEWRVEDTVDAPLSQNFSVNILTGPNGYGKTMILKMIYHLLKKNYWFFHFFEFEEIKFDFEKFFIVVKKELSTNKDLPANNALPPSKKGFLPEKDAADFTSFADHGNSVETISMYLDEDCKTSPVGSFDIDEDLIDNVISKIKSNGAAFDFIKLSTLEILSLYFDSKISFPYFLKKHKISTVSSSDPNYNLSSVLDDYAAYFQPAQRLINLRFDSDYNALFNNSVDFCISAQYEIDEVNAKIKAMYQRVQFDFAVVSQKTDATFITRLVDSTDDLNYSPNDIKNKLSLLEKRITCYRELNLLKDMTQLNYPYKESITDDSSYRQYGKVLSLYIEDMNKKLDVFGKLYFKMSLFLDMISKKVLSDKTLKISEQGISVLNSTQAPLPNLHRLSSGEQNLIILYFNLIFSSDAHTILLIDEPENSLHVAWQQEMLNDYIKIAKTNHCQIIFATHSPTFISNRFDLTINLYRQHHKITEDQNAE
jgi:predicted ATP-binding protein involved in virulence